MKAGRELDAKVAEFMEWDGCHVIHYCEDTWYNYCRNDGCYESGASDENIMMWNGGDPPIPGCKGYPLYSTDISAAWLVEERIAELGLIEEYCFQLNAIANIHLDRDYYRQPQRWQLIHATPEDRCLAALAAVEDK